MQRKCPRPGAPPRRPGRRRRPERALAPAGAARPRCPPSEEQRHHSVEASVRTSGRQSCVASASKTQICRTARRPRGARASSRARCAGRASDLFFVRPNAPGDDLPSPHASGREAGRDKPWRGPSPSSSSCRRRVGIACGMRCDCTARAPRSRSRCSRRPHRSRAGAPRPDAPVPNNACPPPRGRAPSDGSAARRNRLPASRARVALRVSGTSRCLLDVRSGLWPSGLHLHSALTAQCTPVCACKPGRFRSWCFLRNPTVHGPAA